MYAPAVTIHPQKRCSITPCSVVSRLIALCDNHLCAVCNAGVRVKANGDDTLDVAVLSGGGAAPVQLTLRPKRGRRLRR